MGFASVNIWTLGVICVTGALAMPSKKVNTDNEYICPGGGYYPHPVQCERYYDCRVESNPILLQCPGQQLFDLRYYGCNWPELTGCENRTRPEGYPPTTTPPPPEVSTVKPYPCPGDLADALFPDEDNCSAYYRCVHGTSYHYVCATPLVFNDITKACDFKANVDCGTRPIP